MIDFHSMELKLFLVMTLISVHANAQLQRENSTMAGSNTTDKLQQDTVTETQTLFNETYRSTTEAVDNDRNDQITKGTNVVEIGSMSTSKTTVVQGSAEESTPVNLVYTAKQTPEGVSDVNTLTNEEATTFTGTAHKADANSEIPTENIMNRKNEISTITTGEKEQGGMNTISTVEKTTKTTGAPEERITTMSYEKSPDSTSAKSSEGKTSTEKSPEQFFQWLDNIKMKNDPEKNATDKNKGSHNFVSNDRTNNLNNFMHDHDHHHHDHHHEMNPEKMSPKEFFEWLDSIHPDSNSTTVKNIIDTSIISTSKLIIVISTICGTLVLFVAILIAISCCRRKRNLRNDSEKSDFSMNSVISIPEKRNSRSSDIFTPDKNDKNGFHNVFNGIPANNEVWKKLEQLSPTAPAVMPESTKM